MVDRESISLEDHMKELSIAKERGDRAGEGVASLNVGDAYFYLGDFQQAIEYYTQSLSIAKDARDRKQEGRVCRNLGCAYSSLGNFKQALEYHKHHLSIAKEVGGRDSEGKAYGNLGNVYNNLGNFKQAMEYHKEALSIAEEVGDRAAEGKAYGSLGSDYNRLGNFKQAIEYHKKHVSIAKEVGDRNGEGIGYSNLGNDYDTLGNFKQAIEYHKQHLSIAKEVRNRVSEGSAYGNLGNAYSNLSNFKEAMEYHTEALSIAKEVGNRAMEGIAYSSLGSDYSGLGNSKQAIEYHNQSLRIAKEVGDRDGEGISHTNLGCAYNSLGNFKQAIEHHKKALSIAKEVGNRAGEGKAYDCLGSDYISVGNLKQAMEYHKKALSIAKEVGDRDGEGEACHSLGNAYHGLGCFKQATENFKQGLTIFKEVGNSVGEAKAYGSLGYVYQQLGDFEEAIEYHKQHHRIAKDVGNRAEEGKACCGLGNSYLCLGNSKDAIKHHKQYFSVSKEVGDMVDQGTACYMLGLDYESTASFSEALDYYRSSIRLFDYSRKLLQTEDTWKIGFHERHRRVYTALWRILLKAGKPVEALCIAEQGRAQALMDVLKRQYGVDSLPSTSVEPKKKIAGMLNNLSTQTVLIAFDKTNTTINFWMLRKDRHIFFKQKKIEHGDTSLSMDTILKEIGAGVRVKCENRSMDELAYEPSSNREDVGEKDKSCTSSVNSLCPLYDAIIGPIAHMLHGDQLVVVPDGPFCLAPYSALSESIRIRVVPSLTALKLIAGAPDDFHSKSGALLVGDPCLEKVPMHLSQLPYAKKEVEMIGKLLKTTPLTGKDATKDEVLKRLKSVALVHIAAHGCAQSGEIVLTLNPDCISQPPKREDYILTMSDVQAVCLRARLVVLSCCHSGRGEVKSEGVVGIARSFLCAGARSVLVSLWAIDDEATMVFMESFYQHLADGKSASEALHQAMKSLRVSQEFNAVKYWAPFVLIGDDVTLDFGQQK